MTDTQLLTDNKRLDGYMDNRLTKWIRNLGRYVYSPNRTTVDDLYGQPVGFWQSSNGQEQDVSQPTNINILSSAVDTICSKISGTKVRPYFTPVNGTYKTRKLVKTAQIFFDQYYQLKKLNPQFVECLRDALIFELGCIWIRDDKATVERIRPWEFKFDPAELHYGKFERCKVDLKNYPLYFLDSKHPKVKQALDNDPYAKGRCEFYYNMGDNVALVIYNGEIISRRKIAFGVPPVVWMFWKDPIKGAYSTSLVDEGYSYQVQLDDLIMRIQTASALSPANTIFLPTGGAFTPKPSAFSNRIGNLVPFTPSEGAGPAIVSTPRPIDPMYLQLAEWTIRAFYENQGISQLSAQAKKPSGADSGKALQTLDDLESDRHNVVLQKYISFQSEVASRMIDIFPEEAEVLPDVFGRVHGVTWGDIKKGKDLYTIQFSNTATLSKDPQTKMDQIEQFIQMGILTTDKMAKYLEFNDIEDAFSDLSASLDECDKIIERAIEQGDVSFPQTVNIDQLMKAWTVMYNRLDSSDEVPEIMDRMKLLGNKILETKATMQSAMNPPEPEPASLPAPGQPAPMPQAPGAPMIAQQIPIDNTPPVAIDSGALPQGVV